VWMYQKASLRSCGTGRSHRLAGAALIIGLSSIVGSGCSFTATPARHRAAPLAVEVEHGALTVRVAKSCPHVGVDSVAVFDVRKQVVLFVARRGKPAVSELNLRALPGRYVKDGDIASWRSGALSYVIVTQFDNSSGLGGAVLIQTQDIRMLRSGEVAVQGGRMTEQQFDRSPCRE
jgi:hypothetical protein